MASKNLKGARSNRARKERPGRDHELITKAIYEALLKQDEVKNLDIRHNVKVPGIHNRHQIDVYWKVHLAGVDYVTIVQVKKEKRPASKGDILLFKGVLNDIPGQPRGIFVSQAGYQRGALNHARGVGIILIQLSEAEAALPVTMTDLSQAKMELLPHALAMRVTIYNTKITHVNLVFDEVWAMEIGFLSMPAFQPISITSLDLLNDSGQSQQTLHDRVQQFVKSKPSGGEMQLEFTEPTYLAGLKVLGDPARTIEPIKLVRMSLLVDVKEATHTRPLSLANFATYVLNNLMANNQRYVMVERGKEEPQVILSLPHPKKPQT
jgi:hypothetical protein